MLKSREDLIAPSGFLLMFLIIIQPERRISTEKDEEHLGGPVSEPRKE